MCLYLSVSLYKLFFIEEVVQGRLFGNEKGGTFACLGSKMELKQGKSALDIQ